MNAVHCSPARITIGLALCATLLSPCPMVCGQTRSNAGRPTLTPSTQPTRPGEVAGITSPQRTATLASLQPARIVQLPGTEGQVVNEGDVLVVLDDGVQRVRTEMAKAKADSLLDIESARARMLQTQKDLQRLRRLKEEDSAGDRELHEAETKAEMARLALEVAKFKHQQAQREYEHQRLMLQRMRIRAPFSGYVTHVFREIGETITETERILQLVQLDPLEVTVDCPLELAGVVTVGKRVLVRPADPQWATRIGEVVLASRVADPGSQTFKVKIALDNRDKNWRSGLKVLVDFATTVPEEEVRIGEASVTHRETE